MVWKHLYYTVTEEGAKREVEACKKRGEKCKYRKIPPDLHPPDRYEVLIWVEEEEEERPTPKPKKKYNIGFCFVDKKTKKPIANIPVELTDLLEFKTYREMTNDKGEVMFKDIPHSLIFVQTIVENYKPYSERIDFEKEGWSGYRTVELEPVEKPTVYVSPILHILSQKPETKVTEFKPMEKIKDYLTSPLVTSLGSFGATLKGMHDILDQLDVKIKPTLTDVFAGFTSNLIEKVAEGIEPKPEMIEKINKEVAVKSIDEKWFRTEEFKKLVRDLKDQLSHSPHTVTEWFKEAMANTIGKAYDLVLKLTLPEKTPTEEEALDHARLLTAYYLDFIILTSILQVVARAFSFTLLDKLVDIASLVAGVFGFERWSGAVLSPAFNQSVAPILNRYFAKKYQTAMPGVSDLVRFVVRDVWNPKIITPAPERFKEEMKKLGYNEFWSDAYWTAHWIIPSYEQAREMWWRGKISYDEFMDLVHLADYHPGYDRYWRELSQNLPGKIDARWMFEWGQIKREDLKKLLRASGLHEEWLDKVTDAYIKNQLRDELNRVRTRLVSMFVKGYIDETDLRKRLNELGFNEQTIDMTVEEALTRREEETKDELIKIYTTALEKGKISEVDFRNELRRIGVDSEVIERKILLYQARKKVEKK